MAQNSGLAKHEFATGNKNQDKFKQLSTGASC